MIYPRQLTIQLRHKQLLGLYPDLTYAYNVIYTGINPVSLSQTPGNVIDPAWHDFTDFVDGLDKIALSWSTTQTVDGEVPAGEFLPKKGISGSLTFETDAMEFIREHLVNDVAATFNEIEVQITDTNTGVYTGYIMKSADLSWCEFNSLCVFELNLKQADQPIQCIQRTMIADNWQGWFQGTPAGGKRHPRFSYCVERRPNGVLVLEWFLTMVAATIVTIVYTVLYPILFALYILIGLINDIITAINVLPGISILLIPNPKPATPAAVLNSWATLMLEAAGCGREHPAPLIRDYISNVCDLCGISYDAATVDIFFAPMLTITHSDAVEYTEPNPHYNACLFYPTVNRGIRRFKNWNVFGNTDPDDTTYYDADNQPVWALSDMLDMLKKEYNARWAIKYLIDPVTHNPIPYLFFRRKDWWENEPPLYDFSTGGADRSKIVEGICYQQTDFTVPASMNGLYEDDTSDKCGHEASLQYNGVPLSFNNTMVDSHFYGILDKHSGFAAAKFNCDGASTNYLYDAIQMCYSADFLFSLSAPLFLLIQNALATEIQQYTDFAVLLQTETVSKPKILIWDGRETTTPGNPYLNARAIRDKINIAGTLYTLGHAAVTGVPGWPGMPDVNPIYPYQVPAAPLILPTLATPSTVSAVAPDNYWDHINAPKTKVIGKIGGAPPPTGVYEVNNIFGSVIISNPAVLVNYPTYFNPYFKGTMWDLFHWIDSPRNNPKLHKTWSVKISLCKEDILKLGLTTDNDQKLLASVLLDTPFYNNGVITEIGVDYGLGSSSGSAPGTGQTIELKGYV